MDVRVVEDPADLRQAMNDLLRKQRGKVKKGQAGEGEEAQEEEVKEEEPAKETETKVQKIVLEDSDEKKAAYYTTVDTKKLVPVSKIMLNIKKKSI